MRTLTEEQKKALMETSIVEIDRYLDKAGKIPYSLQSVGVETLYDLFSTNIEQLPAHKGFSRKKCIDLQNSFKELPEEVFNDIVFWNKKLVFPTNYNPEQTLFENVDLILDELFEYIKGCEQRIGQIRNDIDKDRVQYLSYIFTAYFKENLTLRYIANQLKFKGDRDERVRQIFKNELLIPLFNGEDVCFFKNIAINEEIVNHRKDCIFNKCTTPPSLFVQHALGIDYVELRDNLGYIIVPTGEKGVYEKVYDSTVDELIEMSIKPTEEEELYDAVSGTKKIIKKVLGAGKVYDNEFINALIYETDLTCRTDNGVIIKPQYIKHASSGKIVIGKASARIVADTDRPMTIDQIKEEYFNRYGEWIKVYSNLLAIEGCQSMGKTHWIYAASKLPLKQDWINDYAVDKRIFYYDDIYKAMTDVGYVIAEKTLRTYITNSCQVDNKDKNHFCHKEYVGDYPEYSWRSSSRYGIVNWLGKSLKALFEIENSDELEIKYVNEWLYNYGIGTEYEETNVYGYATFFYSSALTAEDGPFIVKASEKGNWYLKKNDAVYDSINWDNFGRRGRLYESKLIAVVTNIVRKTKFLKISLMDLVDEIYNGEYFDNFDRLQIRQKILRTIESTYIPHALKLNKLKTGRDKFEVVIDARKIHSTSQYTPTNKEIVIKYKSISQIAALDWDALRPVLYNELAFCADWLKGENLCSYEEAFIAFEKLIKNSLNKNIKTIFPQKLYEFFFVSNPTDDDQYLIMCSIAKNFEALLKDIYFCKTGKTVKKEGLYNLTEKCEFYAFNNVLDKSTNIADLPNNSYEKALKLLSRVRNTDAHGQWYTDEWRGDPRPEPEKNIEKIRNFAALYIFAVAKYLN